LLTTCRLTASSWLQVCTVSFRGLLAGVELVLPPGRRGPSVPSGRPLLGSSAGLVNSIRCGVSGVELITCGGICVAVFTSVADFCSGVVFTSVTVFTSVCGGKCCGCC